MSEAMQMQMMLGMMGEIKDALEALRTNGCNKAIMHGVYEKNLEILFKEVKELKDALAAAVSAATSNKLGFLNTSGPWIFASFAVFSPNAGPIIDLAKGLLLK